MFTALFALTHRAYIKIGIKLVLSMRIRMPSALLNLWRTILNKVTSHYPCLYALSLVERSISMFFNFNFK